MDYEAAVQKIISKQLKIDYDSVKGNFIEDMGADSLDLVELVMTLEEEFDMELPDDIAEELLTFKQIVDYVSRNAS